MDAEKFWYYTIDVREGPPGFACDESYESPKFDSFEKAFRSCCYFNLKKQWENVRHIKNWSFVFFDGKRKVSSRYSDGKLYYRNSERELGITEENFDAVISAMVPEICQKISQKVEKEVVPISETMADRLTLEQLRAYAAQVQRETAEQIARNAEQEERIRLEEIIRDQEVLRLRAERNRELAERNRELAERNRRNLAEIANIRAQREDEQLRAEADRIERELNLLKNPDQRKEDPHHP